jgi:hypothetical protein
VNKETLPVAAVLEIWSGQNGRACQRITQWVDCVGDKLPELLEIGGKKLFDIRSVRSGDRWSVPSARSGIPYRNRARRHKLRGWRGGWRGGW